MDNFHHLEDLPNYQVSPKEEYMNANQLKHFKEKLLMWKRMLQAEVDQTLGNIRHESQNLPDELDRATMEEGMRIELRTRDRERKLIKKIDQALLRIEVGEYGYCKESGEEIGIERLDARPTADLCIEVKALKEQREKQGLGL